METAFVSWAGVTNAESLCLLFINIIVDAFPWKCGSVMKNSHWQKFSFYEDKVEQGK